MKQLFITSNQREVWKKGLRKAFIIEPYVYHKMMMDDILGDFDNISVAPRRRVKQEDLERDNKYVNDKYLFYLDILAGRLNCIHQESYDNEFWEKCLSMGFLKYVTAIHDAFMNYELYFDSTIHDCNIIAESSYIVPADFEEQQELIQYSDFGQEQLFSIYINLFFPDMFSSTLLTAQNRKKANVNKKSKISRLVGRFGNISLKRIFFRIMPTYKAKENTQLGIFGAYFSQKHLDALQWKGKGKINVIPRVVIKCSNEQKRDCVGRESMSKFATDFDRFDMFFFRTMESLFPSVFLEGFNRVSKEINNHFEPFPSLKYLVGESWIGDTIDSMSLAFMQEKGIQHIYNEHNALFYQWSGTMIERRAKLCTRYYTMGWSNNSIPNLMKGASLFEFSIGKRKIKYPITLMSNIRLVKIPEYSSAYGFCAENVDKFTKFMCIFYETLNERTKRKMLYRGPRPGYENLLSYDNEFLLKPYLSELSQQDTRHLTGREVIASSGLVIVDYFATSFLEAMHMNIPTIALVDKDIYYLKEDYTDYFDELIKVGICQNSPMIAAQFIDSIAESVEAWWWDENTQKARKNFLEKNFGEPILAMDYYLSLLENGFSDDV